MTCELCGGAGYLLTDRGVADCECAKRARAARRLATAGIPPRYQQRTLATFDSGWSRSAAAGLLMARRYVEEWPTQRDTGLLLHGPVGIGKTHLVTGMLLALHERYSATVRFVELRELFTDIKATFGQGENGEVKILKPLLECDVLAIDEVGAARDTEWQREATEKLINGRYNAALATLCTTNYVNQPAGWAPSSPALRSQSAGKFGQDAAAFVVSSGARQQTLGDRIGMPMWSRLQEMCKGVAMEGEDVRTTRRRA